MRYEVSVSSFGENYVWNLFQVLSKVNPIPLQHKITVFLTANSHAYHVMKCVMKSMWVHLVRLRQSPCGNPRGNPCCRHMLAGNMWPGLDAQAVDEEVKSVLIFLEKCLIPFSSQFPCSTRSQYFSKTIHYHFMNGLYDCGFSWWQTMTVAMHQAQSYIQQDDSTLWTCYMWLNCVVYIYLYFGNITNWQLEMYDLLFNIWFSSLLHSI
jgi:hypothetical protein